MLSIRNWFSCLSTASILLTSLLTSNIGCFWCCGLFRINILCFCPALVVCHTDISIVVQFRSWSRSRLQISREHGLNWQYNVLQLIPQGSCKRALWIKQCINWPFNCNFTSTINFKQYLNPDPLISDPSHVRHLWGKESVFGLDCNHGHTDDRIHTT